MFDYAYLYKNYKIQVREMQTDMNTRTIAILAVDGENYEVDACYEGEQRKAAWYNVIKTSDPSVHFDHLDAFPSHEQIRKLMN